MAVDVVLTSDMQHTITEAIKCHHIPQDLAETLSKYTAVSLVNQGSVKAEKIEPIPFKLVKQFWECLREKQIRGTIRKYILISMKFGFKTLKASRAVVNLQ